MEGSRKPGFRGGKAGRAIVTCLMLAAICTALEQDSPRGRSIESKVFCDCGCHETLAECSHKVCSRKPTLRKEVAAAIDQGMTDDQILQQLAVEHGSDILVVPRFQGFNTLLWTVPLLVGLLALGGTIIVQRRRTRAR
jgi:cytochrome c-type biogenesis protein CcmH/NrfF